MSVPAFFRQLGVRYIEAALEKAATDAIPPIEADHQADTLAMIINQLRNAELDIPIEEENAPRILTPQK